MPKINIDGKYPCMANWITFRRADSGFVARNCLIDMDVLLSDREVRYLKSLNGNRNPYKINGFSYSECRENYRHLKNCFLIRDSGRNMNFGISNLYTIYIPYKRNTQSIIPKVLNCLLWISFFPIFSYGLYLVVKYGVRWDGGDFFVLNVGTGYFIGLVVGVIGHEAAHAIACLSNRKGKLLEAGVMMNGIIPGAYVLLDESQISSRLKRVQINLAGIEMNLLLSGILMILMVEVKESCILFSWKIAMLYAVIQNVFMALLNISFVEGLDGEHTISTLFGVSIVDAAKANIRMMFVRKRRREYFAKNGINAVANICISVAVLGFQLLIPLLILAEISIWIGRINI